LSDIIPVASRPREIYWMYDHSKSIRLGDNPNKETLIDIPDPVYSQSPVVLVKISLKWGKFQ